MFHLVIQHPRLGRHVVRFDEDVYAVGPNEDFSFFTPDLPGGGEGNSQFILRRRRFGLVVRPTAGAPLMTAKNQPLRAGQAIELLNSRESFAVGAWHMELWLDDAPSGEALDVEEFHALCEAVLAPRPVNELGADHETPLERPGEVFVIRPPRAAARRPPNRLPDDRTPCMWPGEHNVDFSLLVSRYGGDATTRLYEMAKAKVRARHRHADTISSVAGATVRPLGPTVLVDVTDHMRPNPTSWIFAMLPEGPAPLPSQPDNAVRLLMTSFLEFRRRAALVAYAYDALTHSLLWRRTQYEEAIKFHDNLVNLLQQWQPPQVVDGVLSFLTSTRWGRDLDRISIHGSARVERVRISTSSVPMGPLM